MGKDAAFWFDQLEREHDNLRAALRWSVHSGQIGVGLALVGSLRDFWFTRGYISEGIEQATALLELSDGLEPTVERARALATRAWLALWHGDTAVVFADGEEALAICASVGERRVEPFVRNTLAIAYPFTSDDEAAHRMQEEALAVAREVGDAQTMARALANLASWAAEEGNQIQARFLFDESIAISRMSGDNDTLALALWLESYCSRHAMLGETQEALRLVRESLALYHGIGEPWGILRCLGQLAALAYAEDASERALRLYASAALLADRHGIVVHAQDEPVRQHNLAELRKLFGQKRFEELWAEQLAVPIEQVIDSVLAEVEGQQPKPADQPIVRPDGLSPREVEVLGLLATGRINREIATELFISVRTVERHIANIYGKIEARSRAEATAYAFRNDLVGPSTT